MLLKYLIFRIMTTGTMLVSIFLGLLNFHNFTESLIKRLQRFTVRQKKIFVQRRNS
jgi:hypothetical protein